MDNNGFLILFSLFLFFNCIVIIYIYVQKNKSCKCNIKLNTVSTTNVSNLLSSKMNMIPLKNANKCTIDKCFGIDPVSDPKYNMQQIVKQSILLEEHLANKNKRCRDCITKHFLHIIGLSEEAQMLATDKIQKYPLINECVESYNKLFQKWLNNQDLGLDDVSLNCCDNLRSIRKRLIAIYFFDDEYKIE